MQHSVAWLSVRPALQWRSKLFKLHIGKVLINVFSGSGLMSRCTVRDHAMFGASVHSVAPHKHFTVQGCTFEGNGSSGARCDIRVMGHTLLERCVRIAFFVFIVA
jgi:hypothetical protein